VADVGAEDVDAIAVLFHSTSHVRSIAVTATPR
jgi:hypothetical protein